MSSEEIVQFFKDCIQHADKLQHDSLIAGLAQNVNDPKIIEILSLTMAELIELEGPAQWEFHLLDILGWMASNEEPQIVNAACEALCAIFSHTDNRLAAICPKLLPVLYQIFTLPDLTEQIREKVLILLYLAIQTFSYADDTNPQFVGQCLDETYQIWLSLFIAALQTSVKSNLNIKRYILKILTVIFRDFGRYSMKSITIAIQPVWKFLNSNLPLFVWNVVFGVPIEELDDQLHRVKNPKGGNTTVEAHKSKLLSHEFELDEDLDTFNSIESLATQLIELMATLIQKPTLYVLIRFGLFPLINCLSHYMLLSKVEERTWQEDHNQFVVDEEDEVNMQTLRSSSLKVISELIEEYKDEATQSIMIVAEKFLSNVKEDSGYGFVDALLSKINLTETKAASMIDFDAEKLASFIKTSHFDVDSIDSPWKKREIGLLLLGTFSEDIIAFQTSKNSNFNLTQLLESLVKEIESGNAHDILKGRTLWCLSKFTEIITVQNKNLFFPLFKLSALCLAKQNVFPVRLLAAKAVRQFALKIEKLGLDKVDETTKSQYGLNDPKNIALIWSLVDNASEENIHLVLEALLQFNKLNPSFVPATAELTHVKLLEIFKTQHRDQLNGPVIKEFISKFTQNPASFNFVYTTFLPFVVKCLLTMEQGGNLNELRRGNETDWDLLSGLLDIVTQITKNCTEKAQKDEIINFIPKLVTLSLKSDDLGFLQHATVCLKTFVIHNSEQILKNKLTPEIFKLIEKLLQPTLPESASLFVGNLIILTFANLLNNSVDTGILESVVKKIYKSKTPSVVQSLVLVYARLININDKDTLNFLTSFSLEGRLGLKVLIDKWLLHQPLFRGRLTKLSTFYALTKLFLAKDNRVETLLVIGFNPSHTNINSDVYAPFKILSIMIRCLNNELCEHNRHGGEEYYKSLKQNHQNYENPDGRLDTVDDDDDFDMDAKMMDDEPDEKIEVDIDIQRDEDEENDIAKKFEMNDKKGTGLAGVEVGSELYMSEMLDFEFDDGEEADETTEEDLIYLKDVVSNMDLVEMLKSFFTHLVQNEKDYFLVCLKHLLQSDLDLLKKYLNIKI